MTEEDDDDLPRSVFTLEETAEGYQRLWNLKSPWDPAPRDPNGDRDRDQVYRAVGAALTHWEQLEMALALLFGTIIDSNTSAGRAAYGSVVSAAARLDLIMAAADANKRISADRLTAITRLVAHEIGRLVARRNEIAHGQVTRFRRAEGAAGKAPELEGHYLVPPYYNTRKHLSYRDKQATSTAFGTLKYAYTSYQIGYYALQFQLYAERVHLLWPQIDAIHLGKLT